MADIFVSYASEDRQRVEKIAAALEADGFSVWWDRKLGSGSDFSSDIEQALREAKIALVVWSKASVESHWVKDEAVYARDHAKLCPISLDGTEPPMGFRQIQSADMSAWRGNADDPAFAQLLAALRSKAGAATAPELSPAPVSAKPAPRLAMLAGGGALLLLAVLAGFLLTRGGTNAPDEVASTPVATEDLITDQSEEIVTRLEKSVAVLPFIDLSPNSDQEYFSDGLTEEILNSLARLPELKVTARTSAFHFKGKDIPIPQIAESLEVKNIVEGSVRRSGDRLRITAQLIRAEDGFHLWSDTYDGTLEDIFDVQEAIAENIATTLQVYLDSEAREEMFSYGTRDVEAYDHYLRGRAEQAKWHDTYQGDGIWRANQSFAKAVERDPTMAFAYFQMADPYAHYFNANIDFPGFEIGDWTPTTEQEMRDQLMRLLGLAVEHATSREMELQFELNRIFLSGNWRRLRIVGEEFGRVAAEGTGPFDWMWGPTILLLLGEHDSLNKIMTRRVQANDVFNAYTYVYLARNEMLQGNIEPALAHIAEGRAKAPFYSVSEIESHTLFATARFDELAELAETDPMMDGYLTTFNQMRLALIAGDQERAQDLATQGFDQFDQHYGFPTVYLAMGGDTEAAKETLDEAFPDPLKAAMFAVSVANGWFCGGYDYPLPETLEQRFREAQIERPSCMGQYFEQ